MESGFQPVNTGADQIDETMRAQQSRFMTWFPRRWAQAMIVVEACTAIAIATPQHDSPAAPAYTAAASFHGEPLPPDNLTECPAIEPRALDAARLLIKEPQNQIVSNQEASTRQAIEAEMGGSLQIFSERTAGLEEFPPNNALRLEFENEFQGRQDVAKKYGLTIYDPTETYMEFNNLSNNSKSTFDEYFAVAQKYMKNFGITLQTGNKDVNYGKGLHVPSADVLQTPTAKLNLRYLVEAFAAMPQEYVDMSKLKNIVIVAGKHSNDAAYAIDNMIVMNISDQLSLQTFNHEMWHHEDAALCGGGKAAQNDPSYTKYNEGISVYGKHSTAPTLEDVWSTNPHFLKIVVAYENAIAKRKFRMACAAFISESKILKSISLLTDYSRAKDVEDEADVGANIPNSAGWAGVIDPRSPLVMDKFTELLARIWQHDPRVAEYFAAVARRPLVTSCNPATANSSTFMPKQSGW